MIHWSFAAGAVLLGILVGVFLHRYLVLPEELKRWHFEALHWHKVTEEWRAAAERNRALLFEEMASRGQQADTFNKERERWAVEKVNLLGQLAGARQDRRDYKPNVTSVFGSTGSSSPSGSTISKPSVSSMRPGVDPSTSRSRPALGDPPFLSGSSPSPGTDSPDDGSESA